MIRARGMCEACLFSAAAIGAGLVAQVPAVRPLGRLLASTPDSFMAFNGPIRGQLLELKDGRLLVNDPRRRQVVMYSADLARHSIVADTASGARLRYGVDGVSIVPFRGDSIIMIDAASLSMLVLGPDGAAVRAMALPRPQEARYLVSAYPAGPLLEFGPPAFDGQSHIIYVKKFALSPAARRAQSGGSGTPRDDSAAIVRFDVTTRVVDTAGAIALGGRQISTTTANGVVTLHMTVNPVAFVDDWTVTADGRIALIRAGDFHIDWVDPGLNRSVSPRVPFEWQRLTDSDKVALVDSVRAAEARDKTATEVIEPVRADQLADYRPPFAGVSNRSGAPMADREGNIWIRPNATSRQSGEAVYDVIDPRGQITDRVQVPRGLTLVGFGRGVAYVTSRDDRAVPVLSRFSIR